MSTPKISVIVPVYKVERDLPACLESLAAQTFQDFELILVDDGSPDGCGRICDQWANSHANTTVIHQENRGLSGARNSGIDIAAGEYLAFVDSDDLILPAFLEKLLASCETSGADMALCGVEDVREDGASQSPPFLNLPEAGVFGGREILARFYAPAAQCYTVAWNKLYRASLWKNLRYPQGKIHEDDAVAHRLCLNSGKVACLPEPLYHYRLREGSICHTEVRPAHFDGVEALLDRVRCFDEAGVSPVLYRKASAGCWRQYLYLCGQAAQAPSAALCARMTELQPQLRTLPTAGLTLAEKLSAWRWSRGNLYARCGISK